MYRVAKRGALVLVAHIAVPDCTSIAPGQEGIAYASYDRGIIRVDLATRALTVVEAAGDVDLAGVRWIRWHRGSLVAIQGGQRPFPISASALTMPGGACVQLTSLTEMSRLRGQRPPPLQVTLSTTSALPLTSIEVSGRAEVVDNVSCNGGGRWPRKRDISVKDVNCTHAPPGIVKADAE